MRPYPYNLIYLHSHDTGRYLQPYGHAVKTPHLQRLAEEGVLFRQAFCAAPTCSPSRAALLTGQWAHSSGMLGLAHRGFSLNQPERHLAHVLQKEGYQTVLAGLQHLTGKGNEGTLGYTDVYRDQPAEEAARAFLTSEPEQPFFLDVGFFETHRAGRSFGKSGQVGTKENNLETLSRYVQPPAPLPDVPKVRKDVAAYQLAAERLDDKVGVVLEALQTSGLDSDTLVLYTTDHGIPFPKMKCNLTDHGTGVALLMRGPGGFTGGKVFDALVSHVDIFPTLCDLLSIDKPDWLQGASLTPLLTDDSHEERAELFAEVTFHAAFEPKRAVRTKRWKYIRRWGEYAHPVLPNIDDSPSKDVLLDAGFRDKALPRETLYDLMLDPNEANNLAERSEHQATLTDLRGRLERWMQDTNDPLLEKLDVSKNVVVNKVDEVSPEAQAVPWHSLPENAFRSD